jgi:hypothetical protein
MVLGAYYLTDNYDLRYPDFNTEDEWLNKVPLKGYFSSVDQVLTKYKAGNLKVKDKIVLTIEGKHIQTTVGRVIVNNVLPDEL